MAFLNIIFFVIGSFKLNFSASVLTNDNIVLFPLDITEKIRFSVEALKNR